MSRYENYAIKNNVFGTLSAPISSLATTIQLNSWQWARFSVNQLATLENIEDWKVKKREIVLITAIAWDVLTVTRKVAPCPSSDDANTQWQVSYAFSADDTISAYITKEHFDKIDNSINDIYDNWVNKLRTEVISWLQIKVNAWPVLVWSWYYDFAWWNLTLTDNAINYVEIDQDWLLVSNTTDRWDKNTKISKVTTSWWTITKIEDWRLWTVGWEIWWVNIHDLTEKTNLSWNDEFIIADSDNIYNNKKLKFFTLYYNMPFWTWIDWDCVIDTDTRLCAKEYNFRNLTICSGVKLNFCWDWVPVIRVSNCFCNLWEIDLYAWDEVQCCLEKSSIIFDKILNICNNWIVIPQNLWWWEWWCPVDTSTWVGWYGWNWWWLWEAGCDWEWASDFWLGWQPWNNSWWWWGGGWKVCWNCATCQVGTNWWDWWDWIWWDWWQAACRWSISGGWWWWWFGLYKWWNWWSALATNGWWYGWNWWDSCYCWWKWWDACKNPWKWWFWYFCCWWDWWDWLQWWWWDWWDSYYWNWWNGWYSCFRWTIWWVGWNSVYWTGWKWWGWCATSSCIYYKVCYSVSWNWWNWRNWWDAWDNANTTTLASWNWWDARWVMYWLWLFVNNWYNNCINWKWWNWWNGSIINWNNHSDWCTSWCKFGWDWWDWANVYIYSIDFTQWTIDVSWWKWWCWAKTSDDNYYCPWLDWKDWILCYIEKINR